MKITEFSSIINETAVLDEVRMGHSDIAKFTNSDIASGMRAGFEAEMIFASALDTIESDDENWLPDYDENRPAGDFSSIITFFDDGNNNTDELSRVLQAGYGKWCIDNIRAIPKDELNDILHRWATTSRIKWNWKERIHEYLEENFDLSESAINLALKYLDELESSPSGTLRPSNNRLYGYFKEAYENALDEYNSIIESAITYNSRYERSFITYLSVHHEDKIKHLTQENWVDSLAPDGHAMTMLDIVEGAIEGVEVEWPHDRYASDNSGNDYYNFGVAKDIAVEISEALDINVTASARYHGTERTDDTWIIEPDGSLHPHDNNDMVAEIISPPLTLDECLSKIGELFAWAADRGAYTNSSTGLHVGISMPKIGGLDVDWLKLALFLGNDKLLSDFGRSANAYCTSAVKMISDALNKNKWSYDNPDRVGKIEKMMNAMRGGLTELANENLNDLQGDLFDSHGSSISIRDRYIEFRIMGGKDYLHKIDLIKSTLQRYAYVYYIASQPDLHRKEYAKKLYTLLSKSMSTHRDNRTAIDAFVRYNSGLINRADLVKLLRNGPEVKKSSESRPKKDWPFPTPREPASNTGTQQSGED